MKQFVRCFLIGNYCRRFLHLHLANNQFRLRNMFSTRGQLLGIGLNIAKNLNRSVPKIAITRKSACNHFSIKVDVGGELLHQTEDVDRQQEKFLRNVGKSIDINPSRSLSRDWFRGFGDDSGAALILQLKALSRSTLRDPFVIQNICNELLHKELKLNVRQYIDILYCLSVLNVHDEKLLMKILKTITALLNEIYKPSPLINTIANSMRNLLLRHTDALNGIIEWFSTRHSNSDMSDCAEIIRTLAVLNYFPAGADILLQKMLNCEMVEYSSSVKYLNFVWAVTLIDRVQPEMAECVMVPSFRRKLESVLAPEGRASAFLKLINIQAHANAKKFKIKMDSNWHSTENAWFTQMKDKQRKNPIVRSLIDCLANLLPPRTFNTFVENSSGCIIDAVCFFDNNHRPITELEFMKKKNAIKLAVIVLCYKDLCSPGKTVPNGIVEFHKRCLIESDYKVLYLPFNEIHVQQSLRKKTAYLKKKIEGILPNYEIND